MLINLRNALMAGKRTPTAKDYVQDGLVAMWDGIENAGWGTHDDNATSWIDLISNIPMSRGYASRITTPSFLDNCVDFNGVNNGLWSPNPLKSATGDFSIEIAILTRTGTTTYWVPLTTHTGVHNNPRMQINTEGIPRVHLVELSRLQTVNIGNDVLADKVGTVSMVRSGTTFSVYYKDQHKGVMNCSDAVANSLFFNKTNVCVGGDFPVTDGMFAGKIYRLAYYSRALTAAEIAANYAIDKARFNLP